MTTATSTISRILPENERSASVWSAGGEHYERITRQIADAIGHCVDRLDPRAGERVLDVATGTGFAARLARARGAEVTGTDFAPDVIDGAIAMNSSGDIDFRVADAEALPYADGEFDKVSSTFGVMFCGNPERAAGELGRVTKRGGTVALATWCQHGGIFDMFRVIKKYMAKAPSPSPFEWGSPDRVQELLGDDFELSFEEAVSYYREPNAASAWEAFSTGYGPTITLLANLDESAAADFRRDFEAYHENHRTAAGILVPRPYMITVGRRR